MAVEKRTPHPRCVKKSPRNPGLNPITRQEAMHERAIAFWRARCAHAHLTAAELSIRHAAPMLEAARSIVALLEHHIAFSGEQAKLARATLRDAVERLRLSELRATAAGAKPIRSAEEDDPLARECAGYHLDLFVRDAKAARPESLADMAGVCP